MADRSGFQPLSEATAFQAVECSQSNRARRWIYLGPKLSSPIASASPCNVAGHRCRIPYPRPITELSGHGS